MKRWLIRFVVVLTTLTFVIVALVSYFCTTTAGASFIAHELFRRYVEAEEKTIERVEGTLYKGVSIYNIEFKDLKGLPVGSVLRIQRVTLLSKTFDINKV